MVHNDPVPEAEIWQAAGTEVEVVTGRFALRRRPGREYVGELASDFLTDAVLTTVADLASAGARRVGLCFLSVSAFAGPGFDEELAALALDATGVELFTAGAALRADLAARSARRVLVVAPPWFTDTNVEAVVTYLERGPVRVVARRRFELDGAWAGERQDLFDAGAMNAVPSEALRDQVVTAVRALATGDAPQVVDAVVVPGSGFRSRRAALMAQAELAIPVVSANAAVLSHHLRRERGGPGTP